MPIRVRTLHGGRVLPFHLCQMLITPRPLEDGAGVRYAMGLAHFEHPTGRVIQHGGGTQGFLSHASDHPDEDAIVVVLMNTSGPPGPGAVADDMGRYLFGDDKVPQATSFAGSLDPFLGKLRGPTRGRVLTATVATDEGP